MSAYFQDKVVWITGASSGIGEALTYALARSGARLVLSSRKKSELEQVAQRSGLPADRYFVLPLDLLQYQQMPSMARQVLGHFGRIDILINNAGISQRSSVIDTDIEVDRKLMDVDFLGTIALTKAVLPHLLQQQSGQIISVASVAGEVGTPRRSSYAAAKHALIGFMDALRAEVYEKGIRVGVMVPGYVRTNISINALTGDGSPHAVMDPRTKKGLSAEQCAARIVRAIRKRQDHVYIAGMLEMFAVYLKRFFPSLLRIMLRKVGTT